MHPLGSDLDALGTFKMSGVFDRRDRFEMRTTSGRHELGLAILAAAGRARWGIDSEPDNRHNRKDNEKHQDD